MREPHPVRLAIALALMWSGWGTALALRVPLSAAPSQSAGLQQVDLAERLVAGRLRAVNRDVTPLPGSRRGVHVTERAGPGEVWIEGSDFAQGTIEVDVRGRDVSGQSFVGVAFHRKDDNTYDAVYLRPFNFRADDPARRRHAVQYMAVPEYDWSRLRQQFPEEFENPVDASISPTDWVPLRVVVKGRTIQIYVGSVTSPTLEVRKVGTSDRGLIGLWTGDNSDVPSRTSASRRRGDRPSWLEASGAHQANPTAPRHV